MRILVGIMIFCLGFPALAQDSGRRITVTGEGVVLAIPDMAEITLGVTHEARDPNEALGVTSQVVQRLLGRLEAAGFAERDYHTSQIVLDPVYDYRNNAAPPVISGYRATNMVTIWARDLDDLGRIIDVAVQDGVNEIRGLSFDLQGRSAALDQARQAAVRDAVKRAGLYAEAAGLRLGPVLAIREPGVAPGPMTIRAEAVFAPAMDVPVVPGEMRITAQVVMEFAFAE
jgi:uncharacterized protein YggE